MCDNQSDRATFTPIRLGEEILSVVSDAEVSTAIAALEIAKLLILHRSNAQIAFERQCIIGESDSPAAPELQ